MILLFWKFLRAKEIGSFIFLTARGQKLETEKEKERLQTHQKEKSTRNCIIKTKSVTKCIIIIDNQL
jgi:hypothetical protein